MAVEYVKLEPSGRLERLVEAIRMNALPAETPLAVQREHFETLAARMSTAPGVVCRPIDAGGGHG